MILWIVGGASAALAYGNPILLETLQRPPQGCRAATTRSQALGNGFAEPSLHHRRGCSLREAISNSWPPNETLLSAHRLENAPITRLVFERQTCPWAAPIDHQRSALSLDLGHSPRPSRTSC